MQAAGSSAHRKEIEAAGKGGRGRVSVAEAASKYKREARRRDKPTEELQRNETVEDLGLQAKGQTKGGSGKQELLGSEHGRGVTAQRQECGGGGDERALGGVDTRAAGTAEQGKEGGSPQAPAARGAHVRSELMPAPPCCVLPTVHEGACPSTLPTAGADAGGGGGAGAGRALSGSDLLDESLEEGPDGFTAVPDGFYITGYSGKELPGDIGEGEAVVCPECGQATIATRDSVVALVVGGNSMESRTRSLQCYGGLPAVPVLFCTGKDKECSGIGRSGVMTAVYWQRRWVPLASFCQIEGGADSYMEIPCGLSKERAIVQILHWFSKTRENQGDRHACFLPPPLDRPSAVVCRKGQACAYVTYSDDLSKGWLLPTLHTIFVRASHRRMGCASQLLKGFFRPEERGYPRSRKVSGPSRKGKKPSRMLLPQRQSSGVDGEADEVDSQVLLAPIALSSPVDFCDKMGIEPPISDDLILTMASIFSVQELRNIVLLHGGETMQHAVNKSKSLLEHMRSPNALKETEANTPLRRIRSGRSMTPRQI